MLVVIVAKLLVLRARYTGLCLAVKIWEWPGNEGITRLGPFPDVLHAKFQTQKSIG